MMRLALAVARLLHKINMFATIFTPKDRQRKIRAYEIVTDRIMSGNKLWVFGYALLVGPLVLIVLAMLVLIFVAIVIELAS